MIPKDPGQKEVETLIPGEETSRINAKAVGHMILLLIVMERRFSKH
jgi:hypothetical protein